MSIFGAIFVASSGRWIAFDEEMRTSLSEHDTLAEALNACRQYLEIEMRHNAVRPLRPIRRAA